MKYINERIGGRLALFIKFPRALSASLQRIQERHAYLLEEGYMSEASYISENRLRAVILTTDNDFIYRVTKTRMKDFRNFQIRHRMTSTEVVKEKENENFEQDDVNEEVFDDIDEVVFEDVSEEGQENMENEKGVRIDYLQI